ncbi:MAG TPA: DUF4272 domain-containing protein, partial [Polyangiaceae bacterium]|nr:DUF4272 domain-containing protein [Polyangiaceae bacterium]
MVLRHVAVYAYITPPRPMFEKMLAGWSEAEREEARVKADSQQHEFWSKLGPLQAQLSPWEQKFAQSTMLTMSHAQQIAAIWRAESLRVLLWALGLVSEMLPYDTEAGDRAMKAFPGEELHQAAAGAGALRNPEVLEDARSTAELWHWRARTWQLVQQGRSFPGNAQARAAGFHSFDDVVRFAAKGAADKGTIPEPLDEDFPAFGKPYRNLSGDEWSQARSIAMERHFALNWLCGYAPGCRW